MTSEIRANTIKNRVGLGTVSFTNTGPVVSGIVTANTFRLPDATSGSLGRLQFGNGLDLSLFHDGTNSFLVNNTGYLSIQSQDGVNGIFIARNAEVNLYYGPSVRMQTSSAGITVNKDLDVDGHTNLDNVSIAGVSTFSGNADFSSGIDVTGNVTSTGNVVANGTMTVGSYGVFGSLVGADPGSNYYGTTNRFGGGLSLQGELRIDGDIVHIGDTNTKIRFPVADTISFETAGGESLRIDSTKRFLKGLSSAAPSRSSTSVRSPHFQLSSPWSSGLGSIKIECTDDYPIIFIDSNASYANNSGAGVITWSVKDSSGDYCNTAAVRSHIDATPGNDSAPGRLEFHTTTSGSSPTQKLRITSGGQVNIGGDYAQTGYNLSVTHASSFLRLKDSNEGNYDLRFMIQNSEANIWHYGTDDLVIGNRYDRKLHFITNGSKRLTIDGDLLGINTQSPAKNLHVYNSSVATVRIETGDSRGQAWDILSTNGAQNNTGTISIRDESGSSYIDFGANGGDPRLVAQLGGGSNLLYLDKHGNTNLAGICTATAFRGEIYPTIYAGGRRNMFINGEFMINQRGTRNPMANRDNGANGLGYGGPDHVNFVTNLGAFDAKQANENNSPRSQAGASYSYELDCTSASGPSTSNYTYLAFHWSGVEANRLLYGTSNARPVTISFWVQCNKTGNFTATLRNETANKLISSVVTISSSNTWEYKTITFVGDTAAQIAVTISSRWSLELWLDGGSNYTGGTVRTSWTTKDNSDRGAGSTLNICSSTSNYFRISLLQVEMGPYATPFEFRTYGEYLHDCEYYFQKPVKSRGSNQAFEVHIWGHKVADTYALRVQSMMRPTEMRVNPTDYFHDNNPSGLTAQRFQTQGADYEYTYGVAMNIGSNRKEFSGGTKYPYGVNGMGAGESGILWAFDYESSAEF